MSKKFSKCMAKILAAALLLSLTAGLVPALPIQELPSASITAKALDDSTTKIEYDLNETTGELTIKQGTYNNPAFDYNFSKNEVLSVKAEDGVVLSGICDYLFDSFYYVTSIDLSNVDTSNATRMNGMFIYNNNLETLNLAGFNTSNVTEMKNMFSGCSKLKELNLSNFNTQSVTNMQSMFSYCSSLNNLKITSFDTKNVTDMSYMFNNCSALQNIDISNFRTDCVTDMSYMFNNCSSLTSLDLSQFKTENVENTDYMFESCLKLASLDISNFSISEEVYTYNMFSGANISEIIISDDMNITQNMYLRNNGLDTPVFHGDGTDNTSYSVLGWKKVGGTDEIISGNKEYAEFSGKGKYKTENAQLVWSYDLNNGRVVTLKSGYYSSSTIINIHTLTEKYAEENDVERVYSDDFASIYKFVVNDGIKFKGNCNSIFFLDGYFQGYSTEYKGSFDTSEVTDMSYMFRGPIKGLNTNYIDTSGVTSLKNLFDNFDPQDDNYVLDVSNLNTSHITNMSYMFSNCKAKTVKLDNMDTSNVTDMSYMFSNCAAKNLDVSNFNTSKVKSMNSMFYNSEIETLDLRNFVIPSDSSSNYSSLVQSCSNLKSVLFPQSWQPTDLSSFFSDCSSLTSFDLSSINCSKLTKIPSLFQGCNSLENVTFPELENITSINCMFEDCTSLKSIDISNINADKIQYFTNLFKSCNNLETVTLPEITNPDASFYSLFYGCTSLTIVNLQNIKSQNAKTMENMFYNCSSIKNIDLSNVLSEYNYFSMESAFSGCSSLESVKLPLFTRQLNSSSVSSFKNMFSGAEKLQSVTFHGGALQNNSVITSDLKLENNNHSYTGWHSTDSTEIISGSGEYASFTASKGTTYVRDKKTYDKAAVRGSSLTLQGQIGLNFYMDLPDNLDENAYIIISGPKGQQKTYFKDAVLDKNDGYKLTYKLAAKQIHDAVTLRVYDKDGNILTLYKTDGQDDYAAVENNAYIYAISDYIKTVQNGSGYDEKLVNLVNALEAYGTYAQVTFNYNTDSANTDNLAAKDKVAAVSKDTVSNYKCNVPDNLPADLDFKGYTLVLDSETSFRLYFESDNISKYFNTTSPTYYFDESTKLVHVSNNRYYFEISNISARKLRSNYSLSIYTGKIITKIYDDGSSYEYNESVKLNFSPLSYVYSALAQYGNSLNEKDINLCNTVRALYLYSYASNNYFWG